MRRDGKRQKRKPGYDYGRIHAPTAENPRRVVATHIAAWELIHGRIPKGLVVRHAVCDFGLCCNPRHMALGTVADNIADRERRRRQPRKEEAA